MITVRNSAIKEADICEMYRYGKIINFPGCMSSFSTLYLIGCNYANRASIVKNNRKIPKYVNMAY